MVHRPFRLARELLFDLVNTLVRPRDSASRRARHLAALAAKEAAITKARNKEGSYLDSGTAASHPKLYVYSIEEIQASCRGVGCSGVTLHSWFASGLCHPTCIARLGLLVGRNSTYRNVADVGMDDSGKPERDRSS